MKKSSGFHWLRKLALVHNSSKNPSSLFSKLFSQSSLYVVPLSSSYLYPHCHAVRHPSLRQLMMFLRFNNHHLASHQLDWLEELVWRGALYAAINTARKSWDGRLLRNIPALLIYAFPLLPTLPTIYSMANSFTGPL